MKKTLFILVLCTFSIIGVYSSIQQDRILEAVRNGVVKLLTADRAPNYLTKAVKNISKIKDTLESDETICQSCQVVVHQVLTYRRNGANKDSMKTYFNKLCKIFTGWGNTACHGYIDIEIDPVLYMMDNKNDLTPERVCAIYFQAQKCVDPDAKKWIIPLPPPPKKNEEIEEDDDDDQIGPLRILHLTDIHYDPLYKPGSNAVCKDPLCCQSGVPSKPGNAAGYWGDYNVCDMPRHSVLNLLNHIKEKYIKDIDFIYYTGDIISHKSWASSKSENTKTIKEIYGLFASIFPNTTIYPILGNHEPHPTDFYSPEDVLQNQISTQWIFNLSVTEWSRWLPESTQDTILKGGYYSVLIKPGFRIIAINSNFCFTSNLWLMYEDEDPRDQLAWLVEELYKAEKNKERVHILSHIPPGEILCHKQWSNQFHKIINRFAHIISAQFNGHTHIDELKVFLDEDDESDTDKVINVAFNGASFTTFVGFNPNFKIYEVDPSSAMVLDYDQYIFNLTKANQNTTPPQWYKQYSFKNAYNLHDMSLPSFEDLLEKMSKDDDLMWQYYRFLVRDSDVKIKEGCNSKCLKKLLCYITAVETNESVNC
ncbi:sphingomyelin phosphodiesterase 1 [Anoplophora glabripennis]|uniref:sphingomyelin phosphodiesterase 1 n=1 Tax=Anoplophora glabripennis TaxID=217634 RepID=UPI0008743215|nr:sphingomyelin phosphodiesterase 1 [Anoplophora glabripennis]